MAATGVETAFLMLEGRWKMVIIFQLFDREVLCFSELQRATPGISEEMLIQQLRDLERDGVVTRGARGPGPASCSSTACAQAV